jgi:hypothetical protein
MGVILSLDKSLHSHKNTSAGEDPQPAEVE